MTRGAAIGLVLSGIVLAVFAAGFAHEGSSPESPVTAAPPNAAPVQPFVNDTPYLEGERDRHAFSDVQFSQRIQPGFMSVTSGPGYRRAAHMSLKVEDCAKAEEDLEVKLMGMKGEILEMVMEGTEGARICTLSVLIPSDHFREFVSHLRGMGKMQTERITASRLKPGREPAPGAEGHDVRELSHVALRMADEKVAQNVLESRGVLASSFDAGASHFMKGAAVMIEGVGYVLPFLIALVAMALPIAIIVRFRRLRAAQQM